MIQLFLVGDFRYFWAENIGNFANLPSAWDVSLNTGIGKSTLGSLWINSYLNFTAFFSKLGLSWNWISLLFWILPAILLSFFSSFALFNYLFKEKIKYSLLAGIIYTFNTYFLMILTGGQLGVALSYSLAPLVLLTFIRTIKNPTLQNSFVSGLILGLQILFDPRIVYITLLAVFLYLIFSTRDVIKIIKNSFFIFTTPFVIGILLHSYWILPLILTKSSVLPSGFNNIQGFEFFSFADFSHAFSLLHPNWPENIFGKTYFMRPEFLILPILAFSSLLLIAKIQIKYRRGIIFFALLGLIGTFLAKGVNSPFGEINIWLFQNFPGMNIFRDPTKFYIMIALSYSMLIPFSILAIYEWLKSKIKSQKYLPTLFLLFISFYLLLLVRPLWMGELREKLKPKEVPIEYIQLKDFLVSQPEFFRTLWIPQWQRYGFFSNNHPAIGRFELLKQASASGQIEELRSPSTQTLLQDLRVKYIIIPYDSEGEIFLEDRKYDESLRLETERSFDEMPWLKKVRFNDLNHFSKLAVYEVPNIKDRFWTEEEGVASWKMINSTKYVVTLQTKGSTNLVFSESFDPNWQVTINGQKIQSQKIHGLLNGFELKKVGDYTVAVEYTPQRYVYIGLIVSLATALTSIGFLLRQKFGR